MQLSAETGSGTRHADSGVLSVFGYPSQIFRSGQGLALNGRNNCSRCACPNHCRVGQGPGKLFLCHSVWHQAAVMASSRFDLCGFIKQVVFEIARYKPIKESVIRAHPESRF